MNTQGALRESPEHSNLQPIKVIAMKNEHPEEQKTIEDSNPQEVEETLVNYFNSQFIEFAKPIIDSPPTSAEEVKDIASKTMIMYQLGDRIFKTTEALKKLNKGELT